MSKYYSGLGNRQPQWKKDFIHDNAGRLDPRTIALRIDVSPAFVYQYCDVKGIKASKNSYGVERIRRYVDSQPKPFERPPAKYDNKSREEIIEELLSM